ncbi:MAG: phosphotransferase family protein [Thermoanaerobaculia bacterium]|nr:phosphotransferase family protein [Thermoanaerobaculia bacterium]
MAARPAASGGDGGRRDGDLDEAAIARLAAWLKERIPALGASTLPEVTRYAGGASNWTYRLRYPELDLVLRRPPSGTKAKSAHDMARESRILERLAPHYPLVPEALAYCADPEVLGSDFYVMRRIDGIILRRNPPPGLDLAPEEARKLCLHFVDALVALHRIDPKAAGLEELGRGSGYARRQVAGWTERYRKAHTGNVPRARKVIDWLQANAPTDAGSCVIHNDFRLDNVVLDPQDPTHIVGVLDWEMATVGDPLMDLAGALAYWVEAGDDPLFRALRRQPTHLAGMLTRREIVEAYCRGMGIPAIPAADWIFYEVFGLFRLAAIAQQIYLRYHRRETRNPDFRHFWLYVHYLVWRCQRILRRSGA